MAIFSFTLDSFQITDTRSLHEDTDYVAFTLLVEGTNGQGTPRTSIKAMGDVNNGLHLVKLSFSGVVVEPGETVVVNYLIVNTSDKDRSHIDAILTSASAKLSTVGGGSLQVLAAELAKDLAPIFKGRCDGPVAAEKDIYSYDQLLAKTAKGASKQNTQHAGIDSAVGCGRNSNYFVQWEMAQTGSNAANTVPNVVQLLWADAFTRIKAAGLVAKNVGTLSPHAWVASQNPGAHSVVDAGSTVNCVLATGPLPRG